jgi:hypothetical protein
MALITQKESVLLVGPDGKAHAARAREVGRFSGGLAPARTEEGSGLWGFINPAGGWQLSPRWFVALSFSDGVALVQPGENTPWQVIDTGGRTLAFLLPGQTPTSLFEGGLALMMEPGGQILWSAKQRFQLPPGVAALDLPREGLLVARLAEGGKAGYLGPDGKWQIAPEFEDALGFLDGFGLVKREGQWWVIDRAGNALRSIFGDAMQADRMERHWMALAGEGEAAVPVALYRPDGLPLERAPELPAELRGRYRLQAFLARQTGQPQALVIPLKGVEGPVGLILSNGSLAWPADLVADGQDLLRQPEMPYVLKGRSGWGAVDAQGRWVFAPRYKSFSPFRQGHAVIGQYKTKGYALADGKVYLPSDGAVWSQVQDNGLAVIERNAENGVVDVPAGRVLLPPGPDPLYEMVGDVVVRYSRDAGLSGLWQVRDGRWMLPPVCDEISVMPEGYWLCSPERQPRQDATIVGPDGQRLSVSAVRFHLDGEAFSFVSEGRTGWLSGAGLTWAPVAGEALGVADGQVWTGQAAPNIYSWIDAQGRTLYRAEVERVYRAADNPDFAWLWQSMEAPPRLVDVRRGTDVPLPIPASDILVNAMSVSGYAGFWHRRERETRTTVKFPDGKTLTREGFWMPLGADVLAQMEEGGLIGGAVWFPKQQRTFKTGYFNMAAAGVNDWLLATVGASGKYRFLNARLQPVLPGVFDQALPFVDGVTWVRRGAFLTLLDPNGKVLGKMLVECPGQWTMGNTHAERCLHH